MPTQELLTSDKSDENEVQREAEDLRDQGSERRSYQARRQRFPLEGGARRWSTRQRGTSRGYKSGTLHQVNQVQRGKGVVGIERKYDRIGAVDSRKLCPDFQVRSTENMSTRGSNSRERGRETNDIPKLPVSLLIMYR